MNFIFGEVYAYIKWTIHFLTVLRMSRHPLPWQRRPYWIFQGLLIAQLLNTFWSDFQLQIWHRYILKYCLDFYEKEKNKKCIIRRVLGTQNIKNYINRQKKKKKKRRKERKKEYENPSHENIKDFLKMFLFIEM